MTITINELNCRFPLANESILKEALEIAKDEKTQYKYHICERLKRKKMKLDKATEIALNYYLFYEILQPEYLAMSFTDKEQRVKHAIFNKLTDEQKWHYASIGILSCDSIVGCYIDNYKDSVEDNDDFVNMSLEQLYTRGIIYELERLHNDELAGEDL